MCHRVLDDLIRELVTSETMAVLTMHCLSTVSDFGADTTDFIQTKQWLHYYDIFARNGFRSYFRVIRKFIFILAMKTCSSTGITHPLSTTPGVQRKLRL